MGKQEQRDRGVLPRYIRLWLVSRFGESGLGRVLDRLGIKARLILSKPVPHEWYPVEFIREIYEAVEAEFDSEHPDIWTSLGSFIAEHSVSGFLKYMVRLVSVETITTRVQAIWNRYHSSGTAESRILGQEGKRKRGIFTVKGYDAGPLWCRLMDSYVATLIGSTGAKNVKVEAETCIHKGDDSCSWMMSWEE